MELVINPPQEVFDQLVTLSSTTHEWDHQFYDYKYYKDAYEGMWLVAMVDLSKGPTENFVSGGCLSRWDVPNGSPLFGIGMFYTKEEYRGKGYGKPVFQKMMDIVGEENCALTAAVDMSQKYADVFGFNKMVPHWHLEAEMIAAKMILPDLTDEYTTKSWKDVDFNELATYDLSTCPRDRRKKIELFFKQNEVYTRVAFDSTGKIVGYCTIRTINLNMLCFAPFYAENQEVAARLFNEMVEEVPNFEKYAKLFAWFPEVNRGWESLLTRFFPSDAYHLKEEYRTQFTKKIIESRDDVVYSVACSTFQFV